jgi:hypothetical protein
MPNFVTPQILQSKNSSQEKFLLEDKWYRQSRFQTRHEYSTPYACDGRDVRNRNMIFVVSSAPMNVQLLYRQFVDI